MLSCCSPHCDSRSCFREMTRLLYILAVSRSFLMVLRAISRHSNSKLNVQLKSQIARYKPFFRYPTTSQWRQNRTARTFARHGFEVHAPHQRGSPLPDSAWWMSISNKKGDFHFFSNFYYCDKCQVLLSF